MPWSAKASSVAPGIVSTVPGMASPDTMYVSGLAIPGTVATMPGATLEAFADHGTVPALVLEEIYGPAQDVLDEISELGIDHREVTDELERQGVRKFADSWDELAGTVRGQLGQVGRGLTEDTSSER